MKQLVIFVKNSRAATYGLGTYIKQLMEYLKDTSIHPIYIIQYNVECEELFIDRIDNYCLVSIPKTKKELLSSIDLIRYYRNCWYIVRSFIVADRDGTDLLFHFNSYQEYVLAELVKKQYPSCRTIFTVHYLDWGTWLNGDNREFKRILSLKKEDRSYNEGLLVQRYEEEKFIMSVVDKIISLAKSTWDLLRECYTISEEKLYFIPNTMCYKRDGLSYKEKCQLKESLYFPDNEKIVLYVGRLDYGKGIEILLETFRLLLLEYPACKLVIVGNGDFPYYLKRCEAFWNKVVFTGHISRDMLWKFYQIADVGVLLSVNEQCSYVALEMMQYDIPLIANETTGLTEMMLGYKWGILISSQYSFVEKAERIKNEIISIFKSNSKDNWRESFEDCESRIYYQCDEMRRKYLNLYTEI